jgi:tetratricopeptide (TPR) repeat protein
MRKFFKKIFSSDSSEEPKEPPISQFTELEEAWHDFQNSKFEQTIEKAYDYVNDDNSDIKFEANKLVALGNFRLGNYGKSQQIFEMLASKSNNSNDWFNVVTSSTLNGNVDLGRSAFDKAVELYKKHKDKESISIPNMMFYYMQCLKDVNQFELAFEQLNELKKIYTELKITDGTFLHLRGVPFFEHTIDASKDILEKSDPQEVEAWISSFKKSVDNDGKQYLSDLEQKLKNAS